MMAITADDGRRRGGEKWKHVLYFWC